jgi:exopolysaccharide production protein ExoQ
MTNSGFPAKFASLIYTIFLFIVMGGFRNVLAGVDYSVKVQVAQQSPILQFAVIASALLGLAPLVVKPMRAARVIAYSWPLFVLPSFAIVSALWSIDPATSAYRGVILLSVCIFPIGLATAFRPEAAVRIFVNAGTAMIVLSILTALLDPRIGVHQQTDLLQSTHAGEWRGVFGHRTGLGQFSADFIVFAVCLRKHLSAVVLGMALIGGGLCVVMANSGGSIITLTIGLLAVFAVRQVINKSPVIQVLSVIALLVGAALVQALYEDIMPLVLSMLGKSADLTGRGELWDSLLASATGHVWFGQGYIAGMRSLLDLNKYETVPNGQNAYLDMYVAFGLVGTGAIITSWVSIVFMAFRAAHVARRADNPDLIMTYDGLTFVIVFVVIIMELSLGESAALEANNWITPMLGIMIAGYSSLALSRRAPQNLLVGS